MSQYLSRMLLADERIIHATELHWVLYTRGALFITTGALLGYFGPYVANTALAHWFGWQPMAEIAFGDFKIVPMKLLSLLVIALGAIELLAAFIKQISTELVITNRRVIAKYGFISCTSFELLISKVEGANIDQTVLGRLLGFGTILVKGTGGGISPIDHISAPFRFHSALMNVLQRGQTRRDARVATDD